MSAFLYSAILQWKLDLRNKEVLLTYYVVPLVFFGFMGGIFTSINPNAKDTLIQSMTVFGVTMGAYLGSPASLVEFYGSGIKKAYKVGNIPLWVAAVNNFISAFIHLFLMSIIIFIIAPFAFHAKFPINPFLYFISLGVFIIACLSVGTLLGLFIKGSGKLTMVSQFLFLPSIMLSGIMLPADMLPKILQSIGKIFPATWGFQIMQQKNIDIVKAAPLLFIIIIVNTINIYRIYKLKVD